MTFEFSTDYDLIRSILVNERAYRRMVNDSAPKRCDLRVGPVAGLQYVIARDGLNAPAALFILASAGYEPGVAECHFTFVPAFGGWRATLISGEFLQWLWREMPLMMLVGPVPSYNPAAARLAQAVGFRESAVQPNAGKRNGASFDLRVMTIERPMSQEVAA